MCRKTVFLTMTGVTLLLMTLMVLITPEKSLAQDKIVIGICNSLSGFGADLGLAGRQGAGIAVEEINAAGGVNGKQIELIYRDDETNPQKGVSAVNELMFKQGVKVIMGVNMTNVTNAVNKIINDQKVLFLTLGIGKPISDPANFPYTFKMNVDTAEESEILVKYIIEDLRAKKIGIIRDSTSFGQVGYQGVMDALKNYKIEPVAAETYNSGDTDMTGQLLKLKNAGAEQIIAWGNGVDFTMVTNGLARIRWFPNIGSGIGVHQASFFELSNKEVAAKWVGTMQKAFTYPKGGKLAPEVQKFNDKIKSKYGTNIKSYIPNAGIWYDMVRLYAKAVEKVQSQEPDRIKEFIESTSRYDGLVSEYSFSPTRHNGFDIADLAIAWSIRGDIFGKERVK